LKRRKSKRGQRCTRATNHPCGRSENAHFVGLGRRRTLPDSHLRENRSDALRATQGAPERWLCKNGQ
jgi:hypothetical protein